MIKKLINKLFTQKITDEDIECAVDENVVDCKTFDDEQDKAYVGVPAPILNPVDEWFSSSYGCPTSAVTEKQKDYMEQETLIKQQQYQETNSVEPENIHQVMYDLATKSGKTTTQLDPIGGSENFQGGSENIHK
mgnify:CR=1 FL=1|jgi:hypothetical protein|tara:strand:+ start:192 stop:593 length:402 start_codon:yes stop_codon:yes gene_type:complete